MELVKPEELKKTKVLTREQALKIIKQLRHSKKEEREEAIALVEIIFSIVLRGRIAK